jgi:hypothetical protein
LFINCGKRRTLNPPSQGYGAAGGKPDSAADGLRRGERPALNSTNILPRGVSAAATFYPADEIIVSAFE